MLKKGQQICSYGETDLSEIDEMEHCQQISRTYCTETALERSPQENSLRMDHRVLTPPFLYA